MQGKTVGRRRIAAACLGVVVLLAIASSRAGITDPWTATRFVATPLFAWAMLEIFARLVERAREAPQGPAFQTARRWRFDTWLAAALYVGAAVAYFHPILPHLEVALLGRPSDQPGYLWTLWWGHAALLGPGDASLRATDMIFFPEGISLEYHVYSWYNLLLAIPLRSFLSLAEIYNLLQLHTFIVGGLGAFALCRYLTRDSAVSILAGFVYAFSPAHFVTSLAHINIASAQFLPFFVLFFIRATRTAHRSDLALAALFFLLNAACSWYHMIYALFSMGAAYAFLAWKHRRVVLPDVLRSAAVSLLGLLPLAPWLLLMVFAGPRQVADAWTIPGYDLYGADLAALVVPHAEHWLGGSSPSQAIDARLPLSALYPHGRTAYLGWACLLLAACAIARMPARAAPFVCAALFFLLLAMGAHLRVAGLMLPVALPTRLLAEIPFLDSLRAPIRAMLVVYLFLGILAALGMGWLRDRLPAGWPRVAGMALLAALVVLDYASIARERTDVVPPPAYAEIPRHEERFGILDLPATQINTALYMAYQTQHGLPIIEGYRLGAGDETLIGRLRDTPYEAFQPALTEHRVRYVVLHRRPPQGAERVEKWEERLRSAGLTRVYSDEYADLYRVY